MITCSEITIEYLNGFECYQFSIRDGYFIREKIIKIDLIYTSEDNILIYDTNGKLLTVLIMLINDDAEILKNMLSHCTYTKRKDIIEKLNI